MDATHGPETDPTPAGPHFIDALGLNLWLEGGLTHARAEIRPEMWAPGTERPRIGMLATMVDMVVGMPPGGPINPTVDLRISLLSRAPSEGLVHLVCRPAKVGRRLFVGEAVLHTGDVDRPFARGMATFMNQPMDAPTGGFGPRRAAPLGTASFDEMLGLRFAEPGAVEMDARPEVSNGPGNTVQGGAQALLAEIAGERAMADRGDFAVVDLDIRYLNRVRTTSVAATAEVLTSGFDTVAVRVPITEVSDDPRIVSLAALVCRPGSHLA